MSASHHGQNEALSLTIQPQLKHSAPVMLSTSFHCCARPQFGQWGQYFLSS